MFCGCRPPDPPPEVTTVAPGALVRNYRDTPNLANDTWRDRRVSIRLDPGTYAVSGQEVHWFAFVGRAPAIVFYCNHEPPSQSQTVVVNGICRGMIRDRKDHGPNIDFTVRVEGCTVMVLPP